MKKWYLYRLFNARGEVLYVGKTFEGSRRPMQHQNKKWWNEVRFIALGKDEMADTPERIREMEDQAIADEHPKYNIAQVPRVLEEEFSTEHIGIGFMFANDLKCVEVRGAGDTKHFVCECINCKYTRIAGIANVRNSKGRLLPCRKCAGKVK